PKTDSAFVVVDAFDKGPYSEISPGENKIYGYSTQDSGWVAENLKNYFMLEFDRPFEQVGAFSGDAYQANVLELSGEHVGAVVSFKTKQAGEQVNVKVASSFISHEQAQLNLKEIGNKDFNTLKEEGKSSWNKELSRVAVGGGSIDQIRTFYSNLYRTLLFPRMFFEYDAQGNVVHYSPYNEIGRAHV